MISPALDSVARLRRLVVILEAGDADERWLASRLRSYLSGAERGLALDAALELAPMPGVSSWWAAEAMAVRDGALRDLADRFYPGCKPASQAFQIARLSLRYAGSSWLHDRNHDVMPGRHEGTATACLWRAFTSGAVMPLGKRALQTILAADRRNAAA